MTEADQMQRSTDDVAHPVKITREIPLPWLIGAAVCVVAQAGAIWVGQEKQADAIVRMTQQLAEQNKQLQALSVEIGSKNLKDVEHDLKLADHERRLSDVEGRRPK